MLTKSLRIFVRTCWKALDECSDVACNRCSPYDVPKNLRFLIVQLHLGRKRCIDRDFAIFLMF